MIRSIVTRPGAGRGVGRARAWLLALVAFLALPGALSAQATELGRQTLGRPYWHVFAAYAVALLLIGGWVVSISRRLRRVEDRLGERGG